MYPTLAPSGKRESHLEGVAPPEILVTASQTYLPTSPEGPVERGDSHNIIKLINQLTKVHLRLLDNRKTYEDESAKLQAFESLASKFDSPVVSPASISKSPTPSIVSVSASLGSAPTTGHSYAFGAFPLFDGSNETPDIGSANSRLKPQESSSIPLGRTSQSKLPSHTPKVSLDTAEYSIGPQRKTNQSGIAPSNCTFDHGLDPLANLDHTAEGGYKIAHEALLETLSGIRDRRQKVGQRVRDDFEEMAKVLETIWMGTFGLKPTFTPRNMDATHTEAKKPQGSNGMLSDRPLPITYKPTSPVTADPASSITALALGTTSKGMATSFDNGGKVLKKMRRVSFDDEVGASEQEKEVLRRMEEKITGMERRLTKLVAVEKENVKVRATKVGIDRLLTSPEMKAELRAQKEALDTINKLLEGHSKTIEQILASRSTSGLHEAIIDPTPSAGVRSTA